MFSSTRALRQAAHQSRTPLIKFIGPRTIPANIDHSPKPHPASPTGKLPEGFASASSTHSSFSSYRDHAQQHGPLQKSIRISAGGIGGTSGAQLGSIEPATGVFFDISELPARFRRAPMDMAEIEAIESGGAALLG
ncbi:Putative Ribosomal protein YMR-31 [[Torrubiella] hemipterigena]|uniref:Putative Ribosomal protein YMR-31 n=1 Tax=[Torrubiella] hemipterigena TaxID=1531966 RepID=A0A0A1TRI2_9HYPO|nr:Putative Ribosomal protein YMR-31 [[Torrubiella] hemipterigena]